MIVATIIVVNIIIAIIITMTFIIFIVSIMIGLVRIISILAHDALKNSVLTISYDQELGVKSHDVWFQVLE